MTAAEKEDKPSIGEEMLPTDSELINSFMLPADHAHLELVKAARACMALHQPAALTKPFAHFVQPSSFGPFIECDSSQVGAFPAYRAAKQVQMVALTDEQISRLGKNLARKVHKEVIRIVRAFGEKACADFVETYHGADTVIARLAASQEVGK
jgi:hypothetical protein